VVRFLHPRLTSTWAALHRANADVYYTRSASMLAGVVATFCGRNGRKSIYAGASDVDFLPGRQNLQYRRDRWLFESGLRRADAIIAQNVYQYSNCSINYGRKPHLIPSCYTPPEGACADRAGAVLWVGNMRAVKQPELCLDMARQLPQQKFVMIGGASHGDDSQAGYRNIEAQARELPNVQFLGFVPYQEVESHFNHARVFLNTSRYEGFPNTFLQAWARGVPTVAFVDTGSRERDKPVYKVARNMVDATAEVKRLMTDDVHWKQSSDRCRDYYRAHHSVEAITSLYSAVILDVLERHGR
jgi:glycosyltransferase involved in cell wall biosynthesis